ncbi:hypothetical protein [Paenibacillus flagellatus]|nr:hypothetical protein [Paenibacillus flagellatus]
MKHAFDIDAAIGRMRKTLRDAVPVIRGWMTPDGRLPDPYETIYSENYAPANAASVLASVCRNGDAPEAADPLDAMLARTAELLADKAGVSPFCRVFLYHYGLMAMLLAPPNVRVELIGRHGAAFAAYEDDCAVVNTNCAALQWAMELYADALGLRPADERLLAHRLSFIAEAQLESGFINDEVDEKMSHDGMPIAYHAFTLFLLASAFAVVERWPERHASTRSEAERIVRRGVDWLGRAITPDGTFAMVERSSYQTFTWGALTALLAYADPEGERYGASVAAAFASWLPYRHDDGTYGCTPNRLPHSLRTGYESYTHLNMYNLLGLTGVAVAERMLARRVRLSGAEALVPARDGGFVDPASGYAFFRNGGGFFGCALRMHNRQYAPAMQGFHFRLESRRVPIPEARLPGPHVPVDRLIREGVWEGYAVTDEAGVETFPDRKTNAEWTVVEDGIRLIDDRDALACTKTIAVAGDAIRWSYELQAKRPLRSCRHIVPVLVHDGRDALLVAARPEGGLQLRFGDASYELTCPESTSMEMELTRSLLSVSGVSAPIVIELPAPLETGAIVRWTTTLRLLPS